MTVKSPETIPQVCTPEKQEDEFPLESPPLKKDSPVLSESPKKRESPIKAFSSEKSMKKSIDSPLKMKETQIEFISPVKTSSIHKKA